MRFAVRLKFSSKTKPTEAGVCFGKKLDEVENFCYLSLYTSSINHASFHYTESPIGICESEEYMA